MRLTAWPRLERAEDLAHAMRLAEWNAAPWRERGGVVELPIGSSLPHGMEPQPGIVLSVSVADAPPPDAEPILAWHQPSLIGQPPEVAARCIAVDPFMDDSTTDAMNRFVAAQLQSDAQVVEDWRQSVAALKNFVGGRAIQIFGSGPQSADARREAAGAQPCAVWLGTAVMDHALSAALAPGIICIADGIGQLSDLSGAAPIIDAVRAQLARGAHLVVTQELGPLARHVFADHAVRIHAVPMGEQTDDLWKTGRARPLGNVLTTLGLPVAAALSERGGTIHSLGISFSAAAAEPSERREASHWSHHNTDPLLVKKALGLLVREPGSVLPRPGYQRRHYAALLSMCTRLREHGISVAGADTGRRGETSVSAPSPLARVVEAVDKLTATRQRWGMIALLGYVAATAAIMAGIGVGTGTVLLALALGVLLVALGAALLLRLRVSRWMATYERRRRQIEARELELLTQRIDDLEARLDAGREGGPAQ